MDGTHVCGTTNCEIHVEVCVWDDDGDPVSGATVTLEMTAPGGGKTRKNVTTDEDGCATAVFIVYDHESYVVEVIDITGDGMEYTPDDNLMSKVTVQ